jgi:hypothetical protein
LKVHMGCSPITVEKSSSHHLSRNDIGNLVAKSEAALLP